MKKKTGHLNEIKQEKRDATDSNESELRKIYDVNKQDYRIVTKNFETQPVNRNLSARGGHINCPS